MSCKVQDYSGSSYVTFFDAEAKELLGRSADDMRRSECSPPPGPVSRAAAAAASVAAAAPKQHLCILAHSPFAVLVESQSAEPPPEFEAVFRNPQNRDLLIWTNVKVRRHGGQGSEVNWVESSSASSSATGVIDIIYASLSPPLPSTPLPVARDGQRRVPAQGDCQESQARQLRTGEPGAPRADQEIPDGLRHALSMS
jgi:hypothetical protein